MQQLVEQLTSIHDDYVSRLLENIQSDSPVLYHYTSLQNSLEIIQNNKLRFTNILYLNDPSELRSGLEIAEKVMMGLINIYKAQNKQIFVDILGILLFRLIISFAQVGSRRKKAKELKARLDQFISNPQSPLYSHCLNGEEWALYIACLSEKEDDLRQWLPYADNARGVAIGFKPMVNNTHYITKHPKNSISLVSVCYAEESKKEDFLSQFLIAALETYNNGNDITSKSAIVFLNCMTELLVVDLVACKSSHYKDEKEWRLFFIQSAINQLIDEPSPSFYIKNNIIKPYFDHELEKEAIVNVCLGALCKEELNEEALRMVFFSKGLSETSISKSKIEYRG